MGIIPLPHITAGLNESYTYIYTHTRIYMKCLAQSKSSISMISFPLAGQGQIIHDSSSTPGGQQNGLTLPVPQSAESRTGQAGRGQGDQESQPQHQALQASGPGAREEHSAQASPAVSTGPAGTRWDRSPRMKAGRASKHVMVPPLSWAPSQSNKRESANT